MREGLLYIIAAPSGGGKTSLIKALIKQLDNMEVSVSHTTRPPRPNETDGVDYFFVDDAAFQAMVNEKAFVEYATVFNHAYGTAKAQIQAHLKKGVDIVLDIDWQGAKQICKLFENAISVFILPPSLQVLKERLSERKQDDSDTISHRMEKAKEEIAHFEAFDYLVINDDFEEALVDLKCIIKAQRLGMHAQKIQQSKLLSKLLKNE